MQKSLYPFWFLESFLLVFIPHLTSHASVSHKDECLGFIYILCMLLCCKERSIVCNKTKQKQETPDKMQGSRGPQRKAVQSYRAMPLTVHGLGGHKPHPHPHLWQGLLLEAPLVAVSGWWPLTFLKLSLSWGSVTWPLLWVCEYIPSDWKIKITFSDATQNESLPVGTPPVTQPPSTLLSCSSEARSAFTSLGGCRGFRV